MIVIPMAGASKRFQLAGYDEPKFMLQLAGSFVFDYAVSSFQRYFISHPFLFIVRGAHARAFVEARILALGIVAADIVVLGAETAGQAETVERGMIEMRFSDDFDLTIFNIDTFRRGFSFPEDPWFQTSDGYLEVMSANDPGLSFVKPLAANEEPRVACTAEKQMISNFGCTGLYHFRRSGDFRHALECERKKPSASELYVAPLYNHLIAQGRHIHYNKIGTSDVIFCGTPEQYQGMINAT